MIVPKNVRKQIKRFPVDDAERIELVLDEIGVNPFAGGREKLGGYESTWRRRVGNYRIIYEILS